jgi:hypothetical protein
MPDPQFWLPTIELVENRTTEIVLDLYGADGSPLVLSVADELRAVVWSTDGAAPEIEADTGTSNSKVTVDDVGVVNATPARVTVRFHQTDTNALVAATAYTFELYLLDDSDSDLAKPVCRAPVTVSGSSTSSVTP